MTRSTAGWVWVVAALLCANVPTGLAKTYKWVDAQGNVHYSQKPPPKSAQQSSTMNVNARKVVKVRKKVRGLYCGDSKLPKQSDNAAVNISNLRYQIESWKENIEHQNEQREKYIKRNASRSARSSFKKQLGRYDKTVAERECQIQWAEQQLATLEDDRSSILAHHDKLVALQRKVEVQKVQTCGSNNREGVIVVDDEYRAYLKCVRPFDRELRKLKKTIRRSGRDVKLISDE
ncbi:MAG: DUF4124 domain-containing protein [Pseudomonadota bacterium]